MAPSIRAARSLLPLLLALGLACTTAAGARRAELQRALDQARISRSPAEIWPEVQRFLHERGFPLVGEDRVTVGLTAQGTLGKLFSPGFQTRIRNDGSRVLETNPDEHRTRVRAEARPAPGGGSQLRLVLLKQSEANPTDWSEWRDADLELALLQRLDPVAAARVTGAPIAAQPAAPGSASAAAAAPAAATDPWTRVRHLVGAWEGTLPGGRVVRWRFDFVQVGRFVEMRGTPLLFAVSAPAAPGVEELGRISSSGDRLAWHQFTNGGGVDRYVLEPARAGVLVFVADHPESLPPGSRARLTLDGEQEILATLEVAEPGKDFAAVGAVRLKRQQ